jgi:hypothetical protein
VVAEVEAMGRVAVAVVIVVGRSKWKAALEGVPDLTTPASSAPAPALETGMNNVASASAAAQEAAAPIFNPTAVVSTKNSKTNLPYFFIFLISSKNGGGSHCSHYFCFFWNIELI